jgi:hypothetical protein
MQGTARRITLITLLGALQMLAGCVGGRGHVLTLVSGLLTPELFQFKTIVKPIPGKPGGWRAICIHVRIVDADSGGGSIICSFEVGVPIRTENSSQEISLGLAQRLSAEMGSEAAYRVLSTLPPRAMLAPACIEFRTEYRALMKVAIPGSEVSTCGADTPTIHLNLPKP